MEAAAKPCLRAADVLLIRGLWCLGGSQAVSWVGSCPESFVFILRVRGCEVIFIRRVGEGSPVLFDRIGLLFGGGGSWGLACGVRVRAERRLCRGVSTQSEIYRGIFDNYGGTSGKIFDTYRGHYVGEVNIL